jgi:hypothetical protein
VTTNPLFPPVPEPPKPKKGFWHKVKSALVTVASTVVNIGMSGKGGDE